MLPCMALRRKTSKLTAVATAVSLAMAPMSALAQQAKGPPIIRDTEAEQLLREYTRPILRAAGLEKQNIQIVIINESVFNAFVADGRRIFVNYGAMMQSETPNQIIGVMAHETGHLAGGHLSKMREQMAQAQTQMIIAMQLRHDMVRAKISAFMERQDTVYRRYPLSNDGLPARYARAITTYLHGDLRSALAQIDGLIHVQPNNPYFYELRGQALLEGAKPAEAIAPLQKAVSLSNNAPLIEMLLGQALVATDNKAYTEEAIAILRAAVARESEAPLGYAQLAMAYGRKGDFAQADLASAQAAFLRGDNKTARELASRAKTRFAVGTPGWVKADDIVSAKPLPGQNSN